MICIKRRADDLQSGGNWGLSWLLLTLAVLLGAQEVTAQTQTINLNSGFNQGTSQLIAVGLQDYDWQVTVDPLNSNVPRPANVVSNPMGGVTWPTPFPNSRWISPNPNQYLTALAGSQRRSFTYKMCFNLPGFFTAPRLTLQLRADDIIREVRLNGVSIFKDTNPGTAAGANTSGSHLGSLLSITYQLEAFQTGQNCLEVVIEDVNQIITGVNVAGTVTYEPSLGRCATGKVVQIDLSTGTQGNPTTNLVAGQPDTKWFLLSSPGNPSPSPAYVSNGYYVWGIQNNTQLANWIQRIQSTASSWNLPSDVGGYYTYRVLINLNPSFYNNIQLKLRYAADNFAEVKLNNIQMSLCANPTPGGICANSWKPSVNGITLTTFLMGVNSLDVIVRNGGSNELGSSPTGLIVDATLRGTCK